MKASKFTDAQKAFIIRQGEDGAPVAEICRKAGIGYRWRSAGRPTSRSPSSARPLTACAAHA